MFIRKRIIAILGAIAVLVGVLGGLAACSGSSGPQNATQILQSDGYTPSSSFTSSLQGGLTGDSAVTSSQAGTNNSGDVQAVVVFDNASDEGTGAAGVQSLVSGSGITSASNGDVLTLTGPLSAWAAAGNSVG
jgi:hypothetical protein